MPRESPDVGAAQAVLAAFNDPSVMTIVTEGPEHTVVALNQTVREVYADLDLMGRPFGEAVSGVTGLDFPDLVTRVFESGEALSRHGWRLEQRSAPGEDQRAFVNLALRPWHDDQGEVRGVVTHVADVTDQVRRHRAAVEPRAPDREHAQARGLMLSLQDTLLPSGLPVLPGLETAGRYLLAELDAAAGGDWFDMVCRPGGRVALVIGDVASHGVAASAAMGRLRAVLDEHLAVGDDLGATLSALDRYAAGSPDSAAATVVVVDLDPLRGDFTYCTAGHPPPLVLRDGDAEFLQTTGAGPLGSGSDFTPMSGQLAIDDVLVLYSDGLIERPERTPPQATVELREVATMVASRPSTPDQMLVDRLCHATLEELVRVTGYTDDITMLATRRISPVSPLRLTVPARAGSASGVRARLGEWLAPLHPSLLDQAALQHAVGECVNLAVNQADEHRSPGQVDVRAGLDTQGHVQLSVTKPPAVDDSYGVAAHGLAVVNGLIDEVAVHRREDATTITMQHHLSRPVPLLQGNPVPGAASWVDTPFGMSQEEALLTLRGAVDLTAVEELREAMLVLTDGRQRHVTVDLSEVTLLSGLAVQVLLEARDRTERQGIRLDFRAPPGSAAQHVLDLVHLELRPGED
jgi:serine phosphatase RsbU (regulator of sigma subunit)/anti-anti-sigma regulatory factor